MATTTETKAADVQKLIGSDVQAGATKARKMIDQGTAQLSAAVETTMDKTTKAAEGLYKEAAEFSRGNLEAFTKAAQVYFAGVQDLSKQAFALVQGLTEHSIEGAKALGQVKSLKEATDIQSNYARAALEKGMAESAKLQEATLKLAEASFAPLTARMTLAVEKMGKPVSA